MYDLNRWAAVQELHKKKIPIAQIARQLGMSRNTVRRLLRYSEEPKYHREYYPSILDPFKEQIYEWRLRPYEFNGTRIFRELKKRGYTGSIGPIYRYLRILEEAECGTSSKATVRIETPPGDQAQFDWSDYQMVIGGQVRTVYCFSLILAASRKKAICFSLKSDADAIYEAIQELYEDLGGVTLELLIDNPKALVLENAPGNETEIKYNPKALLLAAHLGTELNACPCYWPRKKGKVERPFDYIEEQFVKGNQFDTMEELNRRGKAFIRDWNQEKHTTTGRIPDEFFAMEECKALRPLPETRYMNSPLQSRTVSADSLVSIHGSKYSVPVKYVDKEVYVRIVYGFRIEIYARNNALITVHEVADAKHSIRRVDAHYDEISLKVSSSLPQIRRDFTNTFSNGQVYLLAAEKTLQQPVRNARKILELCDLYEVDILDKFIAYAVEHNQMDIKSFRKLLKEKYREIVLELETDCSNEALASPVPESGLLRDCSYYEALGKEVCRNG